MEMRAQEERLKMKIETKERRQEKMCVYKRPPSYSTLFQESFLNQLKKLKSNKQHRPSTVNFDTESKETMGLSTRFGQLSSINRNSVRSKIPGVSSFKNKTNAWIMRDQNAVSIVSEALDDSNNQTDESRWSNTKNKIK